jgi:hypothetical protein
VQFVLFSKAIDTFGIHRRLVPAAALSPQQRPQTAIPIRGPLSGKLLDLAQNFGVLNGSATAPIAPRSPCLRVRNIASRYRKCSTHCHHRVSLPGDYGERNTSFLARSTCPSFGISFSSIFLPSNLQFSDLALGFLVVRGRQDRLIR